MGTIKGMKVVTNHIVIGAVGNLAVNRISIKDGYVIGISIECLTTSGDSLKYGINEAPKVVMAAGDPARQYGGFEACGIPCFYEGEIQWQFLTAGSPAGLVIITELVPVGKELQIPE